MAPTGFEEIRARRGRPAVLAAVGVWLVAVVSSVFVGVVTGVLVLLALGFPLQEAARLFDADPSIGFLFTVGWFVPFLAALVGIPVAVVLADRIGAWVLSARPVDETLSADRRISNAVGTVALAAGEQPLLLLVDAPWIDAVALGRRRGRYTVVISTGAASLPNRDLEMLAGGALADSIAGNGAARARLATASPGLVPWVVGKHLVDVARRRPLATSVAIGTYLVIWTATILLSSRSGASDVDLGPGGVLAPLAAVVFNGLIVAMVVSVVVALVLWAGALSLLALPIGARARQVADIGMASLTRDPAGWVSLLAVAGRRHTRPPRWSRLVIPWILPQTPAAADRRIEHLRRHAPGAYNLVATARAAPPPPTGPDVGSS